MQIPKITKLSNMSYNQLEIDVVFLDAFQLMALRETCLTGAHWVNKLLFHF